MASKHEYVIAEENKGQRIDQFLTACAEISFTRSQIQKLIEERKVTVNCNQTKASYKLKIGDKVNVQVPAPQKLEVLSENIPLDIVYEDQDLIVINKPAGMVVHPAPGNYQGTLVNALLAHCKDLSGIGGILRPGIVHRLDKDTSGLIVIAKSDLAHQSLTKQFKDKKVFKQYLALVHGWVEPEKGLIETKLGRHPVQRKKMAVLDWEDRKTHGKFAATEFSVKDRYESEDGQRYSLVELVLKTGRTHQIRVHMQHLGHGVAGDAVYGKQKNDLNIPRQMLHASKLGFMHPRTGQYIKLNAELPKDIREALNKLQKR
ncbi:MAG: RluA family pseudouridine synthase [Candidatus Margulisbacteria bacterium]|nr:RluA family pseudouridine synthase [Candidatus Margulisiibacteriota bacterium]